MRSIYVRKNNIKTTSTRQRYLTSESKQEHLITYTDLEVIPEFKSINKELVIELPNELMDYKGLGDKQFWAGINERYINNFKHHTGYDRVAGAIHLNATGTNLHLHLSYIDRKLEATPKTAKRDSYVYVSTGARLKKKDYEESNPNHLKVARGDVLLDFDKVSNEQKLEWKEFMLGDNSNSAKFELRREIRATLQDDSLHFSKCQESGLDIWVQKSLLKGYKDLFKSLNNTILQEYGYTPKYVSNEKLQENGFLPYKKVGKILNDTPNEVQETIIEHNNVVKEYNDTLAREVISNEELTYEAKCDVINELKEENKYSGDKNNTQKQNFVAKTEHVRVLLGEIRLKVERKLEGIYDWARELTELGKREDRGNEAVATGFGSEGTTVSERLSTIGQEDNGTGRVRQVFENVGSELKTQRTSLEQAEENRDRELHERTTIREEEVERPNRRIRRPTYDFEL